jgi:Uma2 family endonuclease
MSTVEKNLFVTPEAYFEYERSIEGRAEYFDGMIFDMAGGTKGHGQIPLNLATELTIGLRGKPCIIYNSDVKIQLKTEHAYLYPDLSVVCGESEESRIENEIIQDPILIVEVLSESTAIRDIGVKFFKYQQIENLIEYVLVDQFYPIINVLQKSEGGGWTVRSSVGMESEIRLESLGLTIPLALIYDKVAFPKHKSPLIR